MSTLQTKEGSSLLQSLLGIEVLFVLLIVSTIAAIGLAAEVLRRPKRISQSISTSTIPPKQNNERPAGYPTIDLDEAKGYVFKKGRYEVSDEFRQLIVSRIPEIKDRARQYGADRIEVVGHTDEETYARGAITSLDMTLLDALNGRPASEPLRVADNVGLGMARAAAVVNMLRNIPEFSEFTIVPLSAGPVLLPNGQPSKGQPGDTSERRRIELRLLRLQYNEPDTAMATPR